MNTKPKIKSAGKPVFKPRAPAAPVKNGGPRPWMPRVDAGEGVRVNQTSRVNQQGAQHEPTPFQRYQVAMMVAIGTPIISMAKIMGLNKDTLRERYAEELETAWDRANVLVGGKLFKTATTGKGLVALTAQKWWLARRGRGQFVEVQKHELSGTDGGPIESTHIELSDEERAIRLLQILASRGEGGTGPASS